VRRRIHVRRRIQDTFEKWSPVLGMGEDAKLLPEEGKYRGGGFM
jgi:hypothetical protein